MINKCLQDPQCRCHSCCDVRLDQALERIEELEGALGKVGGESCRSHLCGVIAEQALKGKGS